MTKMVLIGASGNIGRRVLNEALNRGFGVTAMMRNPGMLSLKHPALKTVQGNIMLKEDIGKAAAGHDIVVSAFGPGQNDPSDLIEATRSLIDGVKMARVKRLIVVGGAGSLKVAPGVMLLDTPEFPASWKAIALAHKDALSLFLHERELEWSFAHPAASLEPGMRTGHYRLGTDKLLTDHKGESRISMEDFAVALIDEAQNHRHIRKRFTVAY